jgi:Domain of unknown function (DUF4331)
MSSHREAPEISKDPVADSTDVYAFVSPDRPDTVTIIANYIPLQPPAGGPNFYEFGDDVLYEIHVVNGTDALSDIVYQFRFTSVLAIPDSFLYNVGPIDSLGATTWNRRQLYSVTRVEPKTGRTTLLGRDLPCPPCNIGPLSTPNYAGLAGQAIHDLGSGMRVFAGQRAEGFYVDLGSIFDLGDLRPLQQLHAHFGLNVPELTRPASGINATSAVNVNTIAIQVPKSQLTRDGSTPTNPMSAGSVIGVYTSASRQRVRMLDAQNGNGVPGSVSNLVGGIPGLPGLPGLSPGVPGAAGVPGIGGRNAGGNGRSSYAGPFVQVSRLANPLFNEVLIPLGMKDYWNSQAPATDSQFVRFVQQPELARLLPTLYPGAFPALKALNDANTPRADLVAVLLTGIPSGIVPGFQNSTGMTQADLLRLNMAIPPTTRGASNLGLVAGDAAGFPNGRRVFDDVTTIELRALAGLTYALVNKAFTPDRAVSLVGDGLTSGPNDLTARGTERYLPGFPYLGTPYSGYDVPATTAPAPVTSY